MQVLITGGAGFLGRELAAEILRRGRLTREDDATEDVERVILADVAPTEAFEGDSRVVRSVGDVAEPSFLRSLVSPAVAAVFHLAAVVSGQAEADFDVGMRVNLDGTRALLEACRAAGGRPRFIFASSVAVYGGVLPEVVPETAPLTPQTSYGTQKAIGELLVSDYSRKGFVDGRSVRLPTVTVRPGRPNAAASSFASGIIREPLNGEDAVCPVDRSTRMWVMSPGTAIGGLIRAYEVSPQRLGWNRSIILPGLSVTVGEMAAALERVGGSAAARRIRWEPDANIMRLVDTWPGELESSRARALGFPSDENFDVIVRAYSQRRTASA